MGSASSKFKKYLQRGDEFAAMQTFQGSAELRRSLDPNMSYGDHRQHNTALHYAARHGMKHLLRTFLADLGGNPNKRNALNETVLHCACQLAPAARSFSAQERRAACVSLLLQWRGAALPAGGRERADVAAQDRDGNTSLHWAAAAGLRRCVELLLAHGAPLFAENRDRLTPCDLAVRAAHHDVAQLLETRMVFADGGALPSTLSDSFGDPANTVNEDDACHDQDEVYSGLRAQDLQEAKDQLLVETSDMLHIPLFTAEALLRDNEWSREALLEKWIKDPVECCRLAGVQAPASALHHVPAPAPELVGGVPLPDDHEDIDGFRPADEGTLCDICLSAAVAPDGGGVSMSCRHRFCLGCWERYLTVKIQDGDAHHILCPAYQCHILVPVDVIERLVSPEMARRYLQFDIKAFVESNRSIKWCPVAGCGRAVRLPETEQRRGRSRGPDTPGAGDDTADGPPPTSHAVDCGDAHLFCWECLGEAHAPCGCARWLQWQCKVAEVRPEQLRTGGSDSEDAANCLWLVTNCKPCPNCKSPIQKNEGCNHMKCSKCKFDFCWVCQESWKRHSSATGGYFRCNRFEAAQRADERQGALVSEAAARNAHAQELSRFLHYYTRFRNHENSQRLEEPLLAAVRHKMRALAAAVDAAGAGGALAADGARFVEDGVRELLKARRVLCGSYVHGYYLEDEGHGRAIFEFMQNELEEVTERLSEMVARPYLRTPRAVIVQTTALARRKRHEFVRAVAEGLVPPETPPAQRRVLSEHTSLAPVTQGALDAFTILHDWPGCESDEDADSGRPSLTGLIGTCQLTGCQKARARHPRTGAPLLYCSAQCAATAAATATTNTSSEQQTNQQSVDTAELYQMADYNMELVIALEMSRLQMIEDKMKQAQATGSDECVDPMPVRAPEETSENVLDDQLKLAIQLSLQESTAVLNRQLQESVAEERDDLALDVVPTLAAEYQRTSADITVDCFLRSLANRRLDAGNGAVPPVARECCFKPCNGNEDGRFQISDIHENGYAFGDVDEFDDSADACLKRSHSTGDLCVRRSGRGFRVRTAPDEPRYHLDSDHSSQHDEKPEDVCRRPALPAVRTSCGRPVRAPLLRTEVASSYQAQSSVEDTTTSDSLNADLEVCDILGSGGLDSGDRALEVLDVPEPDTAPDKGNPRNPFASLRTRLCVAYTSRTSHLSKLAVNKSIELLSEEGGSADVDRACQARRRPAGSAMQHSPRRRGRSPRRDAAVLSRSVGFLPDVQRRAPLTCSAATTVDAVSSSTAVTGLRIRICKSPVSTVATAMQSRHLETDSSNEYESETGIPKSPTLFISGVSISRTPEPKSPAVALAGSAAAACAGRQSRSASLSVADIATAAAPSGADAAEDVVATVAVVAVVADDAMPGGDARMRHSPLPSPRRAPHGSEPQPQTASSATPSAASKVKSASEPEREREVFRFPKSSTDGALSSVLHVQESNLSSDDFHEALFLLERSPKTRDSKRRKKSKKKDKEQDRAKEEASSAL